MSTKLLKAAEVASILDVSKSFVYHLIRTGELSAVHLGSAVRVRPEDLSSFIQSNLVENMDKVSALSLSQKVHQITSALDLKSQRR